MTASIPCGLGVSSLFDSRGEVYHSQEQSCPFHGGNQIGVLRGAVISTKKLISGVVR
jgi:hypothetical protein